MPWRLASAAVVWPGWLHCSTTLALNSALYLRLTSVGLPVLFGGCSIVCSIQVSMDAILPPYPALINMTSPGAYEWKAFVVEQQEVDEAVAAGFKVVAQRVDLVLGELDVGFQHHVGFTNFRIEKALSGAFQQVVDLDAGLGFFV